MIKTFSISNKFNLVYFLYTQKIKKIIYIKNHKKFLNKSKPEDLILINYINYLTPFIVNTVLNVTKILSKIDNIKLFINGNNTLISNTITNYLNKQKIKTISLLHGGTLGHFKKTDFWPFLNFSQLKNKKKSFFQVYSNDQKKIVISQNKNFKIHYPIKNYLEFHNIDFKNLSKIKRNKLNQFNICYVVQIGNSIYTTKLNKINDPLRLYHERNRLFKEKINLKKYKLLVSSYNETPKSLIFNKNMFLKSHEINSISFEHLNVIEMLKKSDIAIFEHPSTSYIEAICLNVPIIIILNNPLYSFNNKQKKLLSKRIHFVDSLDEIIPIIKNQKKKVLNNNNFLKKFYSINKNKNLKNVLINLNVK